MKYDATSIERKTDRPLNSNFNLDLPVIRREPDIGECTFTAIQHANELLYGTENHAHHCLK